MVRSCVKHTSIIANTYGQGDRVVRSTIERLRAAQSAAVYSRLLSLSSLRRATNVDACIYSGINASSLTTKEAAKTHVISSQCSAQKIYLIQAQSLRPNDVSTISKSENLNWLAPRVFSRDVKKRPFWEALHFFDLQLINSLSEEGDLFTYLFHVSGAPGNSTPPPFRFFRGRSVRRGLRGIIPRRWNLFAVGGSSSRLIVFFIALIRLRAMKPWQCAFTPSRQYKI